MFGLTLVATTADTAPEPRRLPLATLVADLLDSPTDALAARAHSPLPAVRPAPFLSELSHALVELCSGARDRAVVRLCADPDPWEVGLESSGTDLFVTVFHDSDHPEVLVHERRVDTETFARRVLGLLAQHAGASEGTSRKRSDAEMFDAMALLSAALPPAATFSSAEASAVSVEPAGEVPVVVTAEALVRTRTDVFSESAVQRSDLLSLLFRGKLRVSVGEHARELSDVFVFLVAEELLALSSAALDAWAARRAYYRRLSVGGAVLAIRVDADAAAAFLTLGPARRAPGAASLAATFPALDVGALVQSVVAFGRALHRSLVRRSRAYAANLLVLRFRARVRELSDRLRELSRNDAKVNATPESYRAFAVASAAQPDTGSGIAQGRLRYAARWTAAIASIDLRATFLCGDILVVGATREVIGLDRRTGEVRFRRNVPRAMSVMTPRGLARIEPDGTLRLIDVSSGEILWTTELAPRPGASTSGAVVSAPRLPPMLILSEGARHLAAIELSSGHTRWRYAARRGAFFRLKRAGKLVVVANGEPALTALDVLSGEVVWRFCDRLRFTSPVAVDHDALFTFAGDGATVGRGGARLHCLDPWSGKDRWSVDLPSNMSPLGAPLIAPSTVVVAAYSRRGTEICAFDRKTGAMGFREIVSTGAASCLVVDNAVIANSETGELVAIDAATGARRYRHVLATSADGDRPRRLDPVLRSGALFVPQHEVFVVRPDDGTLLANVRTDLIPDLLRVDERCDLYVAEESGHLSAFAAGPRLTLVK